MSKPEEHMFDDLLKKPTVSENMFDDLLPTKTPTPRATRPIPTTKTEPPVEINSILNVGAISRETRWPLKSDSSKRDTIEVPVEYPISRKLGAGRVYDKHGHLVIDSINRDPTGTVPTHRIDLLNNIMLPGETVEQMEKRFLAMKLNPKLANMNQSLNSLVPELNTKALEMIREARMEGIKLTPVETNRSQERQAYLFQQGRTRPGPIVTWTLTSNHTGGRAVDFNTTGKGYKWIQENAPRYGLSVLGSMDPGHVELPAPPAANQPILVGKPYTNDKIAEIDTMIGKQKQFYYRTHSSYAKKLIQTTIDDLESKRQILINTLSEGIK